MFLKLSDSPFRSCITHTNNKRMCEVFWYYIVVLNCFVFFCIIIFSLIKKLPGSLSLVMPHNHRPKKYNIVATCCGFLMYDLFWFTCSEYIIPFQTRKVSLRLLWINCLTIQLYEKYIQHHYHIFLILVCQSEETVTNFFA